MFIWIYLFAQQENANLNAIPTSWNDNLVVIKKLKATH